MRNYDWPGNVRELENMMYRLSALYSESILGKEAFLSEIRMNGRMHLPSSPARWKKMSLLISNNILQPIAAIACRLRGYMIAFCHWLKNH